jgi:hypothetical protein
MTAIHDANCLHRINSIFFPSATRKITEVQESKTRFVHYTTAEVAMQIIQNSEVWMRNATTMNDYMEVEHGFQCLRSAYAGEVGQQLKDAINTIFPELSDDLENRFSAWYPGFRYDTYLTCISEHCNTEDKHGRLSMWRAYGGNNGIALVLNNGVFVGESNPLKAYTSPVAYLNSDTFSDEFRLVTSNLLAEVEFLRTLEKSELVNLLFQAFRFAVLCTKHPGFHEEREWRVVYSPTMELSDYIKEAVWPVHGIPQKIQKIPLHNIPEHGFVGAEIPELLERIIIGPTQYPNAIYQAFCKLLFEAGVSDPENRVFVSDIPLRESR